MNGLRDLAEETDPILFVGSLVPLLAITAVIIGRPEATTALLSDLNTAIISNLSWFYLWLVFLSTLFLLYVVLGPWGRINLGDEDEDPEYSLLQYIVLLFTAGLSSGGLEYWGPTSPVVHFGTQPPFFEGNLGTWEGMGAALQYAVFHYGTSAWSVYLVFGVAISYFVYQRDAPFRPAVILAPFLGVDNIDGLAGKTVDIASVVVAVSGITVSFGLGVDQFFSGLTYNYGIEAGSIAEIAFILFVTALFLISVIAGVDKGIRRFADLNVAILLIGTVVCFVLGPSWFLLNLGTETLQGYLTDYIGMSLFFTPDAVGWLGSWTVFFWAWWITFAPMVGVFMARISRGRTLRQLVLGGLIGSFGLTVPWYVATGGSALWLQTTGQANLLDLYSEAGLAGVSFGVFNQLLPFAGLSSTILLLLVVSFLITTLDSATLSFTMITNKGKPSPSALNRAVWGAVLASLTIALNFVGGISILRSFTVVVGIPAAILCAIALIGMVVELEQYSPVFITEAEKKEETLVTTIREELRDEEPDEQVTDD